MGCKAHLGVCSKALLTDKSGASCLRISRVLVSLKNTDNSDII